MLVRELKGLKYPDEFVTRFFFKEGLHKFTGKVLELGASNGSNLSLFYQYFWDVLGVDISEEATNDAYENFEISKGKINASYKFIVDDMLNFVQTTTESNFDVLLLPSSIYYLEPENIVQLFQVIKDRKILSEDAKIFLKIRDIADYRCGKGKDLGNNCYELSMNETGERGCKMTFFSIEEFMKLLENTLPIKNAKIMKLNFENYQGSYLIDNFEWVIWGDVEN